jgi:isoleucyl-tRNA synthetase
VTGVKYRATADWSVLGRKLRKDLARVKNALPNLSSESVKAYVSTGKISVDGIELVAGDLAVSRYVDLPENGEHATNTDNDVVIVLDIRVHPELEGEALARELINRAQKLRKKAGLQATDDVDLFYRFEEGDSTALKAALKSHGEIIVRTVKSEPKDESTRPKGANVIAEEEQEIGEVKLVLSLVRKV